MQFEQINKNSIVIKDKENTITLIYNIDNKEINKHLIYKSIKPLRQANEIIDRLNNNEFELFDINKIEEYSQSNELIILNTTKLI